MANINKYNLLRFKLILDGIPYSFISLFSKRDKKRIIFTSFHNMKFDSNSKYIFLYFIKNCPEYDCKFVINNPELLKKLTLEIGDFFIDTNTKDGKKYAIKAATWFVSALEMPVSGFFMRFRRTVIHLGHGVPLKCVGLMENDISIIKKIYYAIIRTNISFSLATSESLVPIIKKFTGLSKKRIMIAGEPRNDQIYAKKINIDDLIGTKVLYAPTWRHYSSTLLFPFEDFDINNFEDFLVNNNIYIYLRVHPNFEEAIPENLLNCKNIIIFSGKQYPEIMDYINNFDGLITDYSSIYFGYLLLNRPIVFLPYDYELYKEKNGMALDYNVYAPGDKVYTYEDFKKSLLDIKSNPLKDEELRNFVNNDVNYVKTDNSKFIYEKLKDLGKL